MASAPAMELHNKKTSSESLHANLQLLSSPSASVWEPVEPIVELITALYETALVLSLRSLKAFSKLAESSQHSAREHAPMAEPMVSGGRWPSLDLSKSKDIDQRCLRPQAPIEELMVKSFGGTAILVMFESSVITSWNVCFLEQSKHQRSAVAYSLYSAT